MNRKTSRLFEQELSYRFRFLNFMYELGLMSNFSYQRAVIEAYAIHNRVASSL